MGSLLRSLSLYLFLDVVQSQWNYDPYSYMGPYNWQNAGYGDTMFHPIVESNVNLCDKGMRQSPVNLVPNSACTDDHRIHTTRGSYNWSQLHFEIKPYALRVTFPQASNYNSRKPPKADFSNLSPFIPAVHMDVKIPSEHQIYGKQYPGEVHIGHKYGNRDVIIGFFIDVKENGFNIRFEQFLREWEETKYKRDYYCETRYQQYPKPYQRRYPVLSDTQMKQIWGSFTLRKSNFDLYKILPSKYYFTYDGSITVPPCSERAVWRFLDKPMKISKGQYQRLQVVLLHQKDKQCLPSSVAYYGNVNRPLQPTNNMKIARCTHSNW